MSLQSRLPRLVVSAIVVAVSLASASLGVAQDFGAKPIPELSSDFEGPDGSGAFDPFFDGGSDAKLINNPAHVFEGNYAVRLRDDSQTDSSTFTSLIDASEFDKIRLSFSYKVRSFEDGESFLVEVWDAGSGSWTVVKQYIAGSCANEIWPCEPIEQDVFLDDTLVIRSGEFDFTEIGVRFESYASGNADLVFLDAVRSVGLGPDHPDCPIEVFEEPGRIVEVPPDFVCSEDNAILIHDSDDVRVELQGHFIQGANEGNNAAVRVINSDRVTVTGVVTDVNSPSGDAGSDYSVIDGFQHGVVLDGSDDATVRRLDIRGTKVGTALSVWNSHNAKLVKNTVFEPEFAGVVIKLDSSGTEVKELIQTRGLLGVNITGRSDCTLITDSTFQAVRDKAVAVGALPIGGDPNDVPRNTRVYNNDFLEQGQYGIFGVPTATGARELNKYEPPASIANIHAPGIINDPVAIAETDAVCAPPGCTEDSDCPAGEVCDVGSGLCEEDTNTVFVTSTLHTGNLGGLAGADAICTSRALEAGLGGAYRAWLSVDTPNSSGPNDRLVQSAAPYVRTDGVQVAADYADLIDGQIDNPINVDETGAAVPDSVDPLVFTSTNPDGSVLGGCVGYTVDAGFGFGGLYDRTDGGWTLFTEIPCQTPSRLYCVEQPRCTEDSDCAAGEVCEVSSGLCEQDTKTVFVTSTLHTGDLGGLAGADAICASRALEAGLDGMYLAWLAVDNPAPTGPNDRFVQSVVPYVRTDGVQVAADYADLIDGQIDNPINVDETGATVPDSVDPLVFTGTNPDGSVVGGCFGYTVDGGFGFGGLYDRTDGGWTLFTEIPCQTPSRIYCMEQ